VRGGFDPKSKTGGLPGSRNPNPSTLNPELIQGAGKRTWRTIGSAKENKLNQKGLTEGKQDIALQLGERSPGSVVVAQKKDNKYHKL